MQWNADHTEHAHITEVKVPGRGGNNQQYEPQITQNLDCTDKCHRFDLATSIKDAGILFGHNLNSSLDFALDAGNHINSSLDLLEEIDSVFDLDETGCKPQDYFAIASQ